jgi:hypothetical protein
MMLEFSHPKGLAIPAEDRRRLYANRELPEHCQIWIGLYGGRLNTYYGHDFIRWPETGDATSPTCYAVTFLVGHVAFQLWVPDTAG